MNGFWLVYALFILEIFSCNLRAYLVSKKYEKVANTLEELFEQERDWYLMDTPIFWQIFKSKNARAKAIPYPPGPLIPDHVQKAVQEEGDRELKTYRSSAQCLNLTHTVGSRTNFRCLLDLHLARAQERPRQGVGQEEACRHALLPQGERRAIVVHERFRPEKETAVERGRQRGHKQAGTKICNLVY